MNEDRALPELFAFERVSRTIVDTRTTQWTLDNPVEAVSSTTVVTTRYVVTNAGDAPLYGERDRGAKRYRPTHVHVEHNSNPNGSATVTVWGSMVRKDSTLSDKSHKMWGLSGWRDNERPAWLAKIVKDALA